MWKLTIRIFNAIYIEIIIVCEYKGIYRIRTRFLTVFSILQLFDKKCAPGFRTKISRQALRNAIAELGKTTGQIINSDEVECFKMNVKMIVILST